MGIERVLPFFSSVAQSQEAGSLRQDPVVLRAIRQVQLAAARAGQQLTEKQFSLQPVPGKSNHYWLTVLASAQLINGARLEQNLQKMAGFNQAYFDVMMGRLIICTIEKQGK